MTAGTGLSARIQPGLAPGWRYLAALTWGVGLWFALTQLPLLSVAANRLVLGRPVFGPEALGGAGSVILAAGFVGLAPLVRGGRRIALVAVAALVVALLMLADGLGAGAGRSLAGLAPAARAGLGAGSWLTLALLAGGLGFAIRRARLPRLGLAVGAGLGLAVIALGRAGRLDALSLAVEYAARRETVAAAIREHLVLAGAALVVALIGAVLLSLWRRGQGLIAGLLGGIQVVPAVALLGGLVALTAGLLRALPVLRDLGLSALGAVPAIVAIAAYLLLPLWRGLALALRSPDAATLEAAEALGHSPAQILAGIRLPLGAPIMVGALRVAAVQSLGLATLGALVGAGGLGRIVFDGMAQFAPDLILLGAIPVVALSLGAEIGLSRLERAARRRWHA
jgi:osmoprotectant transport system permease protein